jgi:hypothetical protein
VLQETKPEYRMGLADAVARSNQQAGVGLAPILIISSHNHQNGQLPIGTGAHNFMPIVASLRSPSRRN